MKVTQLRNVIFLVITSLLLFLGACADDTNSNNINNNAGNDPSHVNEDNNGNDVDEEIDNEEPVTIQIAYSFGEQSFHDRFDHIDEKLPHINIEYVPYENTLESLEELFSNDILPDIIIQYNDMTPVKELRVIEPIDDIAEKHGFDIDSLDPGHVAYIRSLGDDGEMIGLPDGSSHAALYYNKEIFDLFGVDYPDPTEPMTWPEVFELAKQLTGERNEIEYVGFEFSYGNTGAAALYPFRQFATNLTDPDTGEILFDDKPEIKEYFELMETLYNILGIYDPELEGGCLFCSKTAAMSVTSNVFLATQFGDDVSNVEMIDMAPMPVWPDKPTTAPYYGTSPMIITNYSEHKDEAFEVLLEYISPENQLEMVKTGSSASVLSDPDTVKAFASESEFYADKNREAWFVGNPALYEEPNSPWDIYVDINGALRRLAEEDIDVNTLMRELEEESAGKIEEAMSAR